MGLKDNYSALHRYKLHRGLYIKESTGTSAYIMECQLRRVISKAIKEASAARIAQKSGITLRRFLFLVEKKLYILDKEGLEAALKSYDNGTIEDCIRSINYARTPKQ